MITIELVGFLRDFEKSTKLQVTGKLGKRGKWRVAGIFGAWQNAKCKLKSDKVCRKSLAGNALKGGIGWLSGK